MYVCAVVKIQFDNTSTCNNSIVLALRYAMLCSLVVLAQLFKNSGSTLDNSRPLLSLAHSSTVSLKHVDCLQA